MSEKCPRSVREVSRKCPVDARACVCMMVVSSQRPAAFIVVPVSTRSTTASARPARNRARAKAAWACAHRGRYEEAQ
eukprot:4206578-Pleurochrysis_carterae.AAC.1